MSRLPWRGLVWVLGMAAVVAIGVLVRTGEPSHGGKSLTHWTTQLIAPNSPEADEARQAIRQIGEDALPFILRDLSAKDAAWKIKVSDWLERQSLIKVQFTRAWERRTRAAEAIVALGPDAKRAVPDLVELVRRDDGLGHTAGRVLCAIGPDAVPVAIGLLADTNTAVRVVAVSVLGVLTNEPEPAVYGLVTCLEDQDVRVRSSAARSLGSYGARAAVAIPALQRMMNSRETAYDTAFGLAGVGAEARPLLTGLSSSANQHTRNAALAALSWTDTKADGKDAYQDFARRKARFNLTAMRVSFKERGGEQRAPPANSQTNSVKK